MPLLESFTGLKTKTEWCTDIYPPDDPALGTYEVLYGYFDIGAITSSMSLHDNTGYYVADRFRDFKGGLIDGIDIPLKLFYHDDVTETHAPGFRDFYYAHTNVQDSGSNSPERYFKITFPNAARFNFAGILSSFSFNLPLDGIISYDLNVRVKGELEYIAPV